MFKRTDFDLDALNRNTVCKQGLALAPQCLGKTAFRSSGGHCD
jgi:hypothetical protein